MNRWEIINALINEYGYTRYLEIGLGDGGNFGRIEIVNKVSVDPNKSNATHQSTSDEFFSKSKEVFDLIFIDGDHVSHQVLKDIENSINALADKGTIVMHDCNPSCEEEQIDKCQPGNWVGGVWKAWATYRMTRADLFMWVVDTDHGCGIIQRGEQEVFVPEPGEELNYAFLEKYREELLKLTSPIWFDWLLKR